MSDDLAPAPQLVYGPVLVVDDDPDVRQVLRWALEDAGFEVLTASDGPTALAQAGLRAPDVVVLDHGLPNTDGTHVAADLRRICGEHLPILLVTADGRAAEKARRSGAYSFLHKPFDDAALVDAVRRGFASGK
jgi:two-component system KDP operon response regulator KdpE